MPTTQVAPSPVQGVISERASVAIVVIKTRPSSSRIAKPDVATIPPGSCQQGALNNVCSPTRSRSNSIKIQCDNCRDARRLSPLDGQERFLSNTDIFIRFGRKRLHGRDVKGYANRTRLAGQYGEHITSVFPSEQASEHARRAPACKAVQVGDGLGRPRPRVIPPEAGAPGLAHSGVRDYEVPASASSLDLPRVLSLNGK